MNQHLRAILNFIQQAENLTAEEKRTLENAISETDKELTIWEFKLERTEKVKRTTAILLEETIEELEQKRKAVEAQNRELEIESSLERVRTVAMRMNKPDDMLDICRIISEQLEHLGVKEIRNVQTAIFYVSRGTYMNYEYYAKHKKTFVTETIYTNHEIAKAFAEKMLKGKGEVSITYIEGKKKVQEWLAYQKTTNVFIDTFLEEANSLNYYWHSLGPVALGISTYVPLKDDELKLFQRFMNVFELSYTRYLDIEQAISQAREAQIEAALERVRSKTMAMHNSQDVGDTVATLFDELVKLGVETNRCGILIYSDTINAEVWTAKSNKNEKATLIIGQLDLSIHPLLQGIYDAWKNKESFYTYPMLGDDLKKYYQAINDSQYYPTLFNMDALPEKEFHSDFFFTEGSIFAFTAEPIVAEAAIIFKRFAGVFGQTYRRFLDLQKAEAQAREAQIEAALERVRSRSLAMHKSDELQEVVNTLFERLQELDIHADSANIAIFKEGTRDYDYWVASHFQKRTVSFHMPYTELSFSKDLIAARESGTDFFVKAYSFEEKNEWFNYAFKNTDFKILSDERKQFILNAKAVLIAIAFAKNTGVQITNYSGKLLSESEADILKRFSKVFEQAYTRFLDLQKAEAQAREGQVETALERVRSRTMAMYRSDELREVVATIYEQLQLLGFKYGACTIIIMDKKSGNMQHWVGGFMQKVYPESYQVSHFNHPFPEKQLMQWKSGEKYAVLELSGDIKRSYDEIMFTQTDFKNFPEETKNWMMQLDSVVFSMAYMSHGALTWGPGILSEDYPNILMRFAKVFEQTYTRFLDLQRAEAQARESQIEASLERVRSKAMAMQKSEDLAAAVATVFEELDKLNLGMLRCGIGILNKLNCSADVWTTTKSDHGTIVHLAGNEPMNIHPLFQGAFDAWLHQRENYSYVLQGEDVSRFYKAVADTNFQLPGSQSIIAATNELKQYYFVTTFQSGGLYAFRETPFPEEAKTVMKRFADVFNFTYTRFNDLKQAEAQTREAIKASSLDRVRAEIASMRTTDDLQRITPSIWKELTVLGVPFFRCGVFIMNEEEKKVHVYLSTPDGKPLAVLHLDFDSSGTTRNSIENWRTQKVYTEHWDREQFIAWAKSLIGQGQIKEQETYQGGDLPPESLTLQFVPFAQGMLYVGSVEPLSELQIELVHSLAKAFSTAYARYEDFNKLELAKDQIEKTLVDLKQAQTQLIQSEKMASLGELTAGIAHEIQNPLNFVNNFSEVNKELLEEMKDEIDKGNIAEVRSIAGDVIQNEEKINHHGKRADAIVKGMLQHSRSSSSVKEPTDINALADEYLRLTYHGLRAKDKTFNVTIKTDFDKSVEQINIIPQDIGRVLLNLLTNAFYAVNEKRKAPQPSKGVVEDQQDLEGFKNLQGLVAYEPTVSVSTKRMGDKILISVKDNGNGIPQKVLDKIFQPFFTTKPTGQGTGLGLSLSYDIVKAHGGDLRVETKENDGSVFIIQLPA